MKQRRKLLFLADDDEDFVLSLSTQLEHFGYELRTFGDPQPLQSALDSATEDDTPAAILLDIMFSGDYHAGLRAAERIGRKDVPVLFLSARDDLSARIEAIRAGGEAYFSKPVQIGMLVDRLDEIFHAATAEPYRILILEAVRKIAEEYAWILERAGMSTHIVDDPERIFDAMTEFKPELLLLEHNLGTHSGGEIARAVSQHEAFFNVPVVFLSAETNPALHFEMLAAGGDIFLSKPLLPEHLCTVVRSKAARSRKVHSLAIRDGLTGLLNHAAAKDELIGLFAQAERQKAHLSVAMLDLDRFKNVNDTYGHAAGDRVLMSLARILKRRLRRSDVVARYGGEEFLILLPFTTAEAAATVMDEIRKTFGSLEHSASHDRRYRCTFSCGIADRSFADGGGDPDSLVDAADRALYRAKQDGRDRVRVFERDA